MSYLMHDVCGQCHDGENASFACQSSQLQPVSYIIFLRLVINTLHDLAPFPKF